MLEQIKVEMYCPITGKNTYVFCLLSFMKGKNTSTGTDLTDATGNFIAARSAKNARKNLIGS